MSGTQPTRECAGCGKTFTPRSSRQTYHSTACRKQSKSKSDPETVVIRWATKYGAPIRLLEGWDPDTGDWDPDSPVGMILDRVMYGVHPVIAARPHHLSIEELMYRGAEHRTSEDRLKIPIDARPLADLYHAIITAESVAESEMVMNGYQKAMRDSNPSKQLEFLGRRWPTRWREQQQVSMISEEDPRDQAVTALIAEPENALTLAAMADRIEDEVEERERQG